MKALVVRDLRKSYRRGLLQRTEVLKGISFAVESGVVTGFLGANGSGKTTSMRCILGLDRPDSGEVLFFGRPLDREGRKRIGFLPERPFFYEHLTGEEFLTFYAELTSSWKTKTLKDRIDELLRRVDLQFAKHRPLRNYSKGMLQKIGLAQALIHDPEFVLLDEPMSGLDPDGRVAIAEIIHETAKRGTAVFFSSHLLHDMERLCRDLVVIKGGMTIFTGTTEELLQRGGGEFEIVHAKDSRLQSGRVSDEKELQSEIRRLIEAGHTILEVRRQRPSLEEVFVSMALREPRS